MRLDIAIVLRGLAKSRQASKELISTGKVSINGIIIKKPSSDIIESDEIVVNGSACIYVSRGGLKLEKALKSFEINLKDRICMDIGASTGGFTDCMLQNGAKMVYAIDAGSGQLDNLLVSDSRVVNIEKTNIRYLNDDLISDKIDFISVDVSFISLTYIIPVISKHLKEGCKAVLLVKPQFEAGRANIGKNGVVKSQKVHVDVIESVISCLNQNGLIGLDLDYSPIKGSQGNIEYLMCIYKPSRQENLTDYNLKFDIKKIISDAHLFLN